MKKEELEVEMNSYFEDLRKHLVVPNEKEGTTTGEVVTASILKSYEIAAKN
jgi:hypothetical protein